MIKISGFVNPVAVFKKSILKIIVVLLLVAWLFPACKADSKGRYAPEYSVKPNVERTILLFGVHPLHNPQHLNEVYGPVVDYLNRHMQAAVIRLEASRSYDEFEKKLYGRHFDLALPNPFQTLNSLKYGYRVFGKMGDDNEFRGIILIRKDSKIEKVTDLMGKTVSFPAPTALAATMMPLYYLHAHGLNVNHDIRRLFAGSQESSIMNVYLGKSAAGATWPPPWKAFRQREPGIAGKLMVKWETPFLVNNGLVVRDDVPRQIEQQVASLLFSLHRHEEGRRMLAALPLSRFEPATEATYKPVSVFLKQYNEIIH